MPSHLIWSDVCHCFSGRLTFRASYFEGKSFKGLPFLRSLCLYLEISITYRTTGQFCSLIHGISLPWCSEGLAASWWNLGEVIGSWGFWPNRCVSLVMKSSYNGIFGEWWRLEGEAFNLSWSTSTPESFTLSVLSQWLEVGWTACLREEQWGSLFGGDTRRTHICVLDDYI